MICTPLPDGRNRIVTGSGSPGGGAASNFKVRSAASIAASRRGEPLDAISSVALTVPLLNDPGARGRLMGQVADSIDDYFAQQTQLAAR